MSDYWYEQRYADAEFALLRRRATALVEDATDEAGFEAQVTSIMDELLEEEA